MTQPTTLSVWCTEHQAVRKESCTSCSSKSYMWRVCSRSTNMVYRRPSSWVETWLCWVKKPSSWLILDHQHRIQPSTETKQTWHQTPFSSCWADTISKPWCHNVSWTTPSAQCWILCTTTSGKMLIPKQQMIHWQAFHHEESLLFHHLQYETARWIPLWRSQSATSCENSHQKKI